MSAGNENRSGFLNRWSERKHRAEQTSPDDKALSDEHLQASASELADANGEPLGSQDNDPLQAALADDPGQSPETSPKNATPAPATDTEEPLLTDDDMPAIESLTADSDLKDFFNQGVSAALRKAALRHVFHLPKFNVRDGLNDYDGDYTQFEPLGDTITSDMKWHTARKERDRQEALAREQELLEAEQANELTEAEQADELTDESPERSEPEQVESEHTEQEHTEQEHTEQEPGAGTRRAGATRAGACTFAYTQATCIHGCESAARGKRASR